MRRGLDRFTARAGRRCAAVLRRLAARLGREDADALAQARNRALMAEERLREAVDLLPEGLVFLDAEGRYILWNRRYAEIYHRSADLFAPGRKLAETLRIGIERGDYPEAIGHEEAWLEERLALLRNPGVRHEQQTSDGRWVMIEERFTSDGGVIGLRVDITDLKRQEDALRQALAHAEAANEAKSRFLANISHEIRTPLNGVLGIANVLARTELDPKQREMVRIIESSASALGVLLSDLLDVARIEAGRVELAIEPFDLAELAQDVAGLFQSAAEAKGLTLATAIAPEARTILEGDPARLKQVLINLVSNAVKFTEAGRVDIRLAPLPGPGAQWRFEVADTGIGFPPKEKAALFERFHQADSSITRRFGGSGLGLAICRGLAELMGGRLDATSRPGEGSTFWFEVPLAHAKASDAAPANAGAGGLDRLGRPLRVLVADDHTVNRRVVELMLGSAGVELTAAEDGAQAVAAFRSGGFDVVLMDMQMPVMDGLTAIREIRRIEAVDGRGRTPILALTANAQPEHAAASLAAGADGHLAKPILTEALFHGISAVLEPDPGRMREAS